MNAGNRFFFLAICYIFSVTAFAVNPDEILRKTEKNFLDSRTISAEFELSIRWQLRDTTELKKGKLYLKRPEKYRIELGDALFITDGKTFWRYSARSKQAVESNVKDMQNDFQPGEWLFTYTDKYKPESLDSASIENEKCYGISLIPRDKARFKKLKVWINEKNSLPLKIETTDKNDNLAVYSIISIAKDTPLAKSLFTFRPPKGTEVINMRE